MPFKILPLMLQKVCFNKNIFCAQKYAVQNTAHCIPICIKKNKVYVCVGMYFVMCEKYVCVVMCFKISI